MRFAAAVAALLAALVVVGGCDPKAGQSAKSPSDEAGDPGIMPSAVGGSAPVTNPEAVTGAGGGGTGGGLGQAAKDQARRAAGQASQPAGSGSMEGD